MARTTSLLQSFKQRLPSRYAAAGKRLAELSDRFGICIRPPTSRIPIHFLLHSRPHLTRWYPQSNRAIRLCHLTGVWGPALRPRHCGVPVLLSDAAEEPMFFAPGCLWGAAPARLDASSSCPFPSWSLRSVGSVHVTYSPKSSRCHFLLRAKLLTT